MVWTDTVLTAELYNVRESHSYSCYNIFPGDGKNVSWVGECSVLHNGAIWTLIGARGGKSMKCPTPGYSPIFCVLPTSSFSSVFCIDRLSVSDRF